MNTKSFEFLKSQLEKETVTGAVPPQNTNQPDRLSRYMATQLDQIIPPTKESK